MPDISDLVSKYAGFITVLIVSGVAFQAKALLAELRDIKASLQQATLKEVAMRGTIEAMAKQLNLLQNDVHQEERLIRSRFHWVQDSLHVLILYLTVNASDGGIAPPTLPPWPTDG